MVFRANLGLADSIRIKQRKNPTLELVPIFELEIIVDFTCPAL